MPQASYELRKRWNGPDCATALKHLEKRGFQLTEGWDWIPPRNVEVTEEDLSAIQFMIEEFDYGGLTQ